MGLPAKVLADGETALLVLRPHVRRLVRPALVLLVLAPAAGYALGAVPAGATCHLGTASCFEDRGAQGVGFLAKLSRVVAERAKADAGDSYTARLLAEGLPKIAQKVGEEGVEVALAAVTRDVAGCVEETADLAYHLAVLMEARGYGWGDVAKVLEARHR